MTNRPLPRLAARLVRALSLDVTRTGPDAWLVTGPLRSHLVTSAGCDCVDYSVRGGPCKHQLASALATVPPVIRTAVEELAGVAGIQTNPPALKSSRPSPETAAACSALPPRNWKRGDGNQSQRVPDPPPAKSSRGLRKTGRPGKVSRGQVSSSGAKWD